MRTAGTERHPAGGGAGIVTTCGRRIAVRRLRLATADRPISRIALDVGPDRGGEPGTWAALTAGEARDLADLLLRHAGQAEQGAEPAGPAREAAP
ncbi:hypothetical protein [Streptomyces albogriseolus]|uniref:hypothetical protein n=1 Tax=Streptomyces albogriseolus TaxID=1887 RepID=UPI00345F7CD1